MQNTKVKLFNTLSNQVENFVPLKEGEVTMYVCGPTVYDYVHVGNMRPVVVFDVLRRLFLALGYKVTYVSNYTDVDDRIIEKAIATSKSEKEISDFYIKAFETTITELNALVPDFTPRAMDYIVEMQEFISKLIKVNAAYVSENEVFFAVNKSEKYGELSNINISELQVGARVDENEKKTHGHDFLLWKKTTQGIKWDSPWGPGRPGWHTECVVMINEVFKKSLIDIHGGGFDLKFPHHENEMAQSKAYSGTKLANYWLHNGFINLNNQKMAKSTGNFITADDFIKNYGPAALRLLLLSSHYRAPVNLSEEIILNTQNEVVKLKRTVVAIKKYKAMNGKGDVDNTLLEPFINAISDDLNTPNAISELYVLVKKINTMLRNKDEIAEEIKSVGATIEVMLDILGLDLGVNELSQDDVDVLMKYEQARKDKNYSLSDKYRDELISRGLL